MIFDPTMTKKKKKKKKPFMLEEDGGEGDEGQQLETKETEADGGEEKEFDLDDDDGGRKRGETHAILLCISAVAFFFTAYLTIVVRGVYRIEACLLDNLAIRTFFSIASYKGRIVRYVILQLNCEIKSQTVLIFCFVVETSFHNIE